MIDFHTRLTRKLKKSQMPVAVVAAYLSKQGLDITFPKLRICPRGENYADYTDAGDIHMHVGTEQYRLEVKQNNTDATGVYNWPYQDYMICELATWEKYELSGKLPEFFFLINTPMTHAAILHVPSTRHKWGIRTYNDRTRGGDECIAYTCTGDMVNWMDLWEE